MDLLDFDEPFDPDSLSEKRWAQVPEQIRKGVEQHVAAHLPAELVAKLRDLHAHGTPVGSDPAFFHFGGGLVVRNLCRERLSDDELAACGGFGADWDNCYIGCSQRSLPFASSWDPNCRTSLVVHCHLGIVGNEELRGGDEDLRRPRLARKLIDNHRHGVAGVIHEQLLAARMALTHRDR